MSDELSLVATPDLVVEIAKRFETLILMGQKDLTVDGASEIVHFASGNHYACLGMVAAKYNEMILEANEDE